MRIKFISFLFLSFLSFQLFSQDFENVQIDAEIKKAANGNMQVMKMTTYYNADGKMVTMYSQPDNIVIINNEKGNVTIYDRNNNSLVQSDNAMYSTRTNELYYFLQNESDDMGLSEMGFQVKNTLFEDGFIVTNWVGPEEAQAYFSNIKLVHSNYNPIYIEYTDAENNIVKKMYFSKYQNFNYIDIPTAITSIDFKTPTDSIVTRFTYEQIYFNRSETTDKLNFEVPANAKLIK